MFKRIEKRRRKKEEEEELGIDEEMKDVLGMQDTDSDESDEDEDSDEEERHIEREENLLDDGEGALDDTQEDEGEEEEEEEKTDEPPFITVQEALRDPLYVVSLQPEVKSCVVCPGKVLKGVSMYDVHRTSNAHTRRFKVFQESAARLQDQSTNAWDNLPKKETKNNPGAVTVRDESAESKRAQKRRERDKRYQQKKRRNGKPRLTEGDDGASTSTPGEAPRKKAKVSIDDAKDEKDEKPAKATENTEKEKPDAPTTRPHRVRTKTRPRVAPSSSNDPEPRSQPLNPQSKPQAEGHNATRKPKPGKRRIPKDGSVRTK